MRLTLTRDVTHQAHPDQVARDTADYLLNVYGGPTMKAARTQKTKAPKVDAREARRQAVSVAHRDMSTAEIQKRFEHAEVLQATFERLRERCARTIREATAELREFDELIEGLRDDATTLMQVVERRHC